MNLRILRDKLEQLWNKKTPVAPTAVTTDAVTTQDDPQRKEEIKEKVRMLLATVRQPGVDTPQ